MAPGSGTGVADDVRRGLTSVWLGIGHLLAWVACAASGLQGVAIPKIVGLAILPCWIVQSTRWVQRSSAWSGG